MLKVLLLSIVIITFFIHVKFSSALETVSKSIHLKDKYSKERQRFESLLAAGRTLTYPYATGLILSAFSSQSENWRISLKGMNGVLDLSPEQLLDAYSDTVQVMKEASKDFRLFCGTNNVVEIVTDIDFL